MRILNNLQPQSEQDNKRKLDQIQQVLEQRLPEPKRRKLPPSPPKDKDMSESSEVELNEFLTTTMKVTVDSDVKSVMVMVDSGSPKSFATFTCGYNILSHLTFLEKSFNAPFGKAIQVGWAEGTINNSPVRFKCYLLAEGSDLETMDADLLLGNRALKQNGATVNFADQTISFGEIITTTTTTTSTTTTTTTTTSTTTTTTVPVSTTMSTPTSGTSSSTSTSTASTGHATSQ